MHSVIEKLKKIMFNEGENSLIFKKLLSNQFSCVCKGKVKIMSNKALGLLPPHLWFYQPSQLMLVGIRENFSVLYALTWNYLLIMDD